MTREAAPPSPPRPEPWATTEPREALRDNNAARIMSTTPGACRQQVGNRSVAYFGNMVDFCGHDEDYSPDVFFTGQKAMTLRSKTQHVHGGGSGGKCEPIEHARQVRVNGVHVPRDGDQFYMDDRRTVGEANFVRDTACYPAPKDTDPIPGSAKTSTVAQGSADASSEDMVSQAVYRPPSTGMTQAGGGPDDLVTPVLQGNLGDYTGSVAGQGGASRLPRPPGPSGLPPGMPQLIPPVAAQRLFPESFDSGAYRQRWQLIHPNMQYPQLLGGSEAYDAGATYDIRQSLSRLRQLDQQSSDPDDKATIEDGIGLIRRYAQPNADAELAAEIESSVRKRLDARKNTILGFQHHLEELGIDPADNVRVTGQRGPDPKRPCLLIPYGLLQCPRPPGQTSGDRIPSHHAVADRAFRATEREGKPLWDQTDYIPGMSEGAGLAMCLQGQASDTSSEHGIATQVYEDTTEAASVNGMVRLGVAEAAAAEGIELATDHRCKAADVQAQLRAYHQAKGIGPDTWVRQQQLPLDRAGQIPALGSR